jgi:hypothetical protein
LEFDFRMATHLGASVIRPAIIATFIWVVGVLDWFLISLCRCRGCQNCRLGHDRFVGLERRRAVRVPKDAGR